MVFWHQRGLRKGDRLSLMLFILAIDPIQKILEKATEHYQNGGILVFLNSNKTLPVVIAHGNPH